MEEEEIPCKRTRTNDDDDDDAGTGSLAGGGEDRLSALSDCLLHEIMSRVQARQVVQTCVLSTRWRHFWRSIPCIDADQREFDGAAAASVDVSWEKFEDFMDSLLSPGNVSIADLDKFRLHIANRHYADEKRRGYRWLRRGIKFDGIGIRRQGFNSSRSWRLRKLQLDNVSLDALFSEHIRSGCPNLQDLELNACRCEFHAITSGSLKNLAIRHCMMIGVSEITSPALNSLVIDGGSNVPSNISDALRLVITAPAAASVFLHVACASSFRGGFSVREMTPLAIAKTSVRLWVSEVVDYLILGGVSHAMTNLELTGYGAMVPDEWSVTCPQFNNLRVLELNRCDLSLGFQMLVLFLRNSPNLERLTLRRCKYPNNDSKNKRRSSRWKNLLNGRGDNLKLIEVMYQCEDIRQLIELLLCISDTLPSICIKLIKNIN